MVVPTKKLSRSRSRKRRYQKEKIKSLQLQPCKNCGSLVLAHRVCPDCGYYRGRLVLTPKTKQKEEK
ncbi:50S ribosomal protein L32 [bacterium HR35]|nr:50S ribosomal protein L32 [bacterium HR35]